MFTMMMRLLFERKRLEGSSHDHAREEHVIPSVVTIPPLNRPLLCSMFVSLQWQSLFQDLQAKEEHSRGIPSVWIAETCWGDTGQWELEAGRHAPWGRGSKWVDCCQQWVDEYNAHFTQSTDCFCEFLSVNDPLMQVGTLEIVEIQRPNRHTTKFVIYWTQNSYCY